MNYFSFNSLDLYLIASIILVICEKYMIAYIIYISVL